MAVAWSKMDCTWLISVVPSLLATALLTAFFSCAARSDRLLSWVSCMSTWVEASLVAVV